MDEAAQSVTPFIARVERFPHVVPKFTDKKDPAGAAPAGSTEPLDTSPLTVGGALTGVLESVLDPITLEQFRDEYYGQAPVHIPGPAERFSWLFNWDSLNRLLNEAQVPHPSMKLVLDGKTLSASDATTILEQIQKGASLIVDNVERYDPEVQKFAASMVHDLGERIRVNLYVSQLGKAGFKRHYDTHDVLVLQLSGAKRWLVYGAGVASPLWMMKRHGSAMPETPLLDCTLRAGDVLYVPRGFEHEALAEGGISSHLTLGFPSRTGIDYLTWLVDELREDSRWRKELPLIFADEIDTGIEQALLSAHAGALHALLRRTLMDPQLPIRYERFRRATSRAGVRFDFPAQLSAQPLTCLEGVVFRRPVHQQAVLGMDENEGTVQIGVWDRVLTFSRSAEELLRFVFTSDSFTGEDLAAKFSALATSNLLIVCNCLVAEGIVNATGPAR